MLTLPELNKRVCENDFRVVGYRINGELVINIGFGNDVYAAKDKYDELSRLGGNPDVARVVLYNCNTPIMAQNREVLHEMV